MNDDHFVGAYWGRRPEPAERCAQRAETFFQLLSQAHPSYVSWYEKNNSTRRALQLGFEPTRDTFVRFFGKKKYQVGKDGFQFGAWTGHEKQDQGGMLTLCCGGDAEVAPNSVLFHFPIEPLGGERMLTLPVVTGVMRALALAWEPDWALATSTALWDELSRQGEADTFVGWMTYVTRRWGEVPALPEPVRVEPVDHLGTLITLTPERLTSTRPDHVALGHQVQRLLEERGLLQKLLEPRAPPA